MIVFHIPSWYPSRLHPYSGIFIKEYIEAYASQYPQTINIVSNHLQNYYPISFKMPFFSLKNIIQFFTRSSDKILITNNIITIYTPKTLGLSPAIFSFKKKELIKKHSANFDYCIKKYGKPDIIHSYITFPAGDIGYELSKKNNIPYIITEHLGPFLPSGMAKDKKLVLNIRQALSNAKTVISVSASHQKQVEKMAKRPVNVIPNIINEKLFTLPDLNTKKNKIFTFLTITSSLHNAKGIDTLIKAIHLFNKSGMSAIFKIGGSTKFLKQSQLLSEKLGTKNIEWFGKLTRNQVSESMKSCDAFVLASREESFGVVYAEAIACGKPVIATKCGGPEDIVNVNNGVLVPIDNALSLAGAMEKVILNYECFDPVVIRNDFLNRFSAPVVTSQYHQLYADIIK